MKWPLIVIAALAAIVLVVSFPVEAQYASKSKLIQRVQQDPGAELFGDAGTPIGSPQQIIIEDPKAYLGSKDESGAELVSEGYLKEQGIYPLQLQTVRYVVSNVRYAAIAGLLFSLFGVLLINRKQRT